MQVLRAVKKFKQLRISLANAPVVAPVVTSVEECEAAENLWVRTVQNLLYQRDFKTLSKQFNLFQDETGVWRCGGRLSNAEIPYSTKYPILLPSGHSLAFTYTGVDFAGPVIIHASSPSFSKKVWIALFTCYVTRAVHLEVVPDQSTPAFVRCLKRFAARRGLPRLFILDNGKPSRQLRNILMQFSRMAWCKNTSRELESLGSST